MVIKRDCFISYSTKDRRIVSHVAEDLSSAGLTVWQDKTEIRPGNRLREHIEAGIKNSASIVIFISQNSMGSRWVLNELDSAMMREISERREIVIPILIGNAVPELIPQDLLGKKYIDLRGRSREKYRRERRGLIDGILSICGKDESELIKEFIVGPDCLDMMTEHRLRTVRSGDAWAMIVSDEITLDIIDTAKQFDADITNAIDLIVSNNGINGIKDVIHYGIHYLEIVRGGEVSDDQLEQLFNYFVVFVNCFALQAKLMESQTAFDSADGTFLIAMGKTPDGKLAYRLKQVQGPKGHFHKSS